LGQVELARVNFVCGACRDSRVPLDHRLGIDGYVTAGARRLLSLSGASWSFAQARDRLRELCGVEASAELIRRVTEATGAKMAAWMPSDGAAGADFPAAAGEAEFQTDATTVNTLEGWRDMKMAVFAKRPRGASATTDQWADRNLPKPTACFAVARIAECSDFAADWGATAQRLGIDPDSPALTVLADGAGWIWNRAGEQFPHAAGVLDVFHAIEHVADTAKKCFGEGTVPAREQTDRGRALVLSDGYAGAVAWVGELSALAAPGFDGSAAGNLLNYFAGHQGRMNYALRLHRGQSIGSGQVEGAAKSMIGRRLKINSCRWRADNANRMAGALAALYSNCWARYWDMN
jgi:hypothetical protein